MMTTVNLGTEIDANVAYNPSSDPDGIEITDVQLIIGSQILSYANSQLLIDNLPGLNTDVFYQRIEEEINNLK